LRKSTSFLPLSNEGKNDILIQITHANHIKIVKLKKNGLQLNFKNDINLVTSRGINLVKPIGLGPSLCGLGPKKPKSKKTRIKEAHKAKTPIKALWIRANPWAFLFNMKNVRPLLIFNICPKRGVGPDLFKGPRPAHYGPPRPPHRPSLFILSHFAENNFSSLPQTIEQQLY